jgi:hypothetical protein
MRTTAVAVASVLLLQGGAAWAADPLVPPPAGARLLMEAEADGVQIYTCTAKGTSFDWVLKAPEANLFDKKGMLIATHFAGPTWKTSDGASVVGEVVARADAPAAGAIPWLLLRAKSHTGLAGLAGSAFIRRAETKGGVAPATGCDAAHPGAEVRMRYSALYQFFAAP